MVFNHSARLGSQLVRAVRQGCVTSVNNLDALALVFVPNVGGGRTTNRVDFLGTALLAAGLGALQTVLERGQEDDWFQSTEIIVLSLIGAPGLAAFIAWKLSIPTRSPTCGC